MRREASTASASSAMAAASRAAFHCLQRRFDQPLAAEMQRRLHGVERERRAVLDRGAPACAAARAGAARQEHRADRAAGGARLGELRFELGRAAGEGGVDRYRRAPARRRRRRPRPRRRRRLRRGRAHRARACESRCARRRGRRRARPIESARASGVMREPGGAHLVVDQPRQVALAVGVARQRRGVLGALADDAQRRVAAQIAGLDHDAAFARPAAPAAPRPRARCCGCRP